ncbi:hypothetical protein D3C71_2103050 [compost metagenome]
MRTKKELLQAHQAGTLPAIASAHITNTGGAVVHAIEHGINTKLFGFIHGGSAPAPFFVRLEDDGDRFRVGGLRFKLSEFMRV